MVAGIAKYDKPEAPNGEGCFKIYEEPQWSGVFKVYDTRKRQMRDVFKCFWKTGMAQSGGVFKVYDSPNRQMRYVSKYMW